LLPIGVDEVAARVGMIVTIEDQINIEVVDRWSEPITEIVCGVRADRVVGGTMECTMEGKDRPLRLIAVFGNGGLEEFAMLIPVVVFAADIEMQDVIVDKPVRAAR